MFVPKWNKFLYCTSPWRIHGIGIFTYIDPININQIHVGKYTVRPMDLSWVPYCLLFITSFPSVPRWSGVAMAIVGKLRNWCLVSESAWETDWQTLVFHECLAWHSTCWSKESMDFHQILSFFFGLDSLFSKWGLGHPTWRLVGGVFHQV